MAASSGDDVPKQLAALLGRATVQIRKTDETPTRVSVIDVIAAITGKDKNQAAEDLRRLTARHPDAKANCFDVKFRDSRGRCGQKDTLVTECLPYADSKCHLNLPESTRICLNLPEIRLDLPEIRLDLPNPHGSTWIYMNTYLPILLYISIFT